MNPKARARLEVALETLRVSGMLQMRVLGTSMLPSVWPGDLLSIRRATASEVGPGDLVLYLGMGGLVVHRVVSNHGGILIARGDARHSDDPPAQADQVCGKVVAIRRGGFRLTPPSGRERAQRLLRFLLRRFSPFKALAMRLIGLRLRLHRLKSRKEAIV